MYLDQILRYTIILQLGPTRSCYVEAAKVNMGAAKNLLYLAGTTDFTIVYKNGGFKLTAFSDSNWDSNPDNNKSTSCYIMMFSRASVSLTSGVQI